MTQGRLVLRKRTPERSQAGQSNVENPETTAGAVGGETLLNIPPCSMAEGPGEQSQSLFRPPMSDPESGSGALERCKTKGGGATNDSNQAGGSQSSLLRGVCTPIARY